MATIYKLNRKKDDSPYYYAKYKTANGEYAYKSTGLTKKREAKNLANEWEVEELKLAKKESKRRSASAEEQREIVNKLIAEQNKQGWKPHITIKAIKKIHSLCAKEDLEVQTLRGYLAEWIIQQKLVVKETTYKTYIEAIRSIDRTCESIMDKELWHLDEGDISSIQKGLMEEADKKGTTRKTINYKMEVLKGAIRSAWKSKKISEFIWNLPTHPLPEEDSKLIVPFSLEEIESLIQSSTGNWKGMVLFAAYTGLRITNCATLRWEDIDQEERILVVEPVKQRRAIKTNQRKCLTFALNDSLWNYLKFIGLKEKGFIFPEIEALHKDTRSKRFIKIMETAGVPRTVTLSHDKDEHGNPRIGWRSFHSLRHSFNSFLANSGVSQETRKKYTGHSTDAANKVYTHEDVEAIREDLQALPDINWDKAVM